MSKIKTHFAKRKLARKEVEKILARTDWPAYWAKVEEDIRETYRCNCKECRQLPRNQRAML